MHTFTEVLQEKLIHLAMLEAVYTITRIMTS